MAPVKLICIVVNGIFAVGMIGLVRYLRSGKEDKIGKVKLKRNRLTNSKYFKKFCKDAFEQVWLRFLLWC